MVDFFPYLLFKVHNNNKSGERSSLSKTYQQYSDVTKFKYISNAEFFFRNRLFDFV